MPGRAGGRRDFVVENRVGVGGRPDTPGPVGGRTRTRTNTNPNGTEANAAGRSGNARALRKQSKCGMIQEGEGHLPNPSKKIAKCEVFVGVADSTEQ